MYNLLIADDEYEIRNGLCNFFPWNEIGFKVIGQAENGKQAFEFIEQNSVDVLLCDIIMPVMTGLELAKKIKDSKSRTIIIFLSGHKNFEYAQQALEYGVNNYILKSTNYNDLIRVFSKVKIDMDEKSTDSIPNILQNNSNYEMDYNEKIISIIKGYVNENFQSVTLEDLTNQVHMNPDYISKFFKQKTGQNFSDYLIEVRMKKAAELLDDIKYKTYEVSDIVGYSNSFNFTRAFKSYYGMNPRQYRNRNEN